MQILEFGNTNNPKIILIHGFQSPYQVWNKYIEHYRNTYHMIVPILPGHNPEMKEDFTSFAEAAKELEDYCISCYGSEIYAVYGMSMGGVLAATIWQNQRLHIEKIIFDGSPLVGFIKKPFIKFYLDITHKTQARDAKTVKQAVGSIISEENLEDFLKVLDKSDTTIINCVISIANHKLPKDIEGDTKAYFFHGTAINELFARKSAKYVAKYYPGTVIKCFKGMGHCENALLHPEVMIKELDKVLN